MGEKVTGMLYICSVCFRKAEKGFVLKDSLKTAQKYKI